jgi:hypothetical protein
MLISARTTRLIDILETADVTGKVPREVKIYYRWANRSVRPPLSDIYFDACS